MGLVKGKIYIIKDSVKTKVTERPIEYCGRELHNGEEYHSFFDSKTRLFHWLKEEEVELFDPLKLRIKKGDLVAYYDKKGIVVHAKNVDDIGVSWNLDNPTRPDIIFTQTALRKL